MLLIRRRCGFRQTVFIVTLAIIFVIYKLYSHHRWLHHTLDVIIVEEHHEVLPYWYRAAWAGKLQLRHNTLLHIDAHADFSLPQMAPHFPMFRTPESMGEVSSMMQRNDVFIVASIISKLLSRVVWIWPSWDWEEHINDTQHNIMQLGFTDHRMSADLKKELVFCNCFFNKRGKECSSTNKTDPMNEAKIDETECSNMNKAVFEPIQDTAALANLHTRGWIPSSPSNSFILDIDLDYFGTESPAEVILRESFLSWDKVSQISSKVSQLFCPTTVKAETASDKLLGALIDTVIMDCKSDFSPGAPLKSAKGGSCETILKDMSSFVEAYLHRMIDTNLNLLCSGDKSILLRQIKSLTKLFVSFDVTQLQTIQRVGFCMKASPKTFFFEYLTELHEFGVCCGWNTPNETVVTYHYSTANEINAKMKQLKEMLATRNYPTPGIVTIARSMRDGYTSKRHYDLIEDSLLQVLTSVFPEKELRIVYDEDLMNGKDGRRWRERLHPKSRSVWS